MNLRTLALPFILLLAGCAAIQPPPGGKEDKTPPAIEEVTPAAGSLNVPRTTKLHFHFKHNVDRSSFTSAITVTPYMNGVVKYDWYGYDEVVVNFPDTLRSNRTYIVTLTKDFKTIRGGSLTEPYQLIFSTGGVIDTGIISGTILPPLTVGASSDLKNVSVFGYDLSMMSGDTLSLNKTRPDYITQPTDKGTFEFRAMKPGHRYRIIALTDEFRNRVFDPGVDSYGMPMGDVSLDANSRSGILIRMMPKADTAKPQLQDWEMTDAYHIRARFSKGLDSASIRTTHFSLTDSLTGSPIAILAAFRENIEKKPGNVMLVLGSALSKGKTYKLAALTGIHDLFGNPLDSSADSLWMKPADLRDTFPPPHFGGLPFADSTRGILPEFEQVVAFTDAVDTASFEHGLQLFDSSLKPVPLIFRWIDGIRVKLSLENPLLPKAWYRFVFANASVKSPGALHFGTVKDTTLLTRFFTTDRAEYGTVSGTITTADSNVAGARIVVRLLSSDGLWTQKKILPAGVHDYVFDKIPKNRYRVEAWITRLPDGSYDGGSPIPLKFALPSGDYPDELDVRPKWTLEHVDIKLQ